MLIRRIAEGDQLAIRTLFGRHRVPLYRWLLRLVGDEALAEDLLSDVFLDVWRQAAAFEARSSVSTCVCTENSDSHVLVMQSAQQRMRCDASDPLNRAREWRIFVQRSVRSQIVVIAGIGLQNPA
jgi:hypothetical protein